MLKFANKITGHTNSKDRAGPRTYTFRMLLEAGSDANARNVKKRNCFAILAAYRFGYSEEHRVTCAKLLLDNGIKISIRDSEGKTAIDLLRLEDEDFAQLLKSRLADAQKVMVET